MSSIDTSAGRLKAGPIEWVITCKSCKHVDVVHRYSRSHAEADFMKDGWKKVHNYWRCPTCVHAAELLTAKIIGS